MSTTQDSITELLIKEIKDIFLYHFEELKELFKQMIIIFACSIALTYAWYTSWVGGISWDIFQILHIMLPANLATLYIIPIGFFLGLIFLFALDDYKRIQGLFLFLAGLLGIFSVVIVFDALEGFNWLAPMVIVAGLISVVFGMLYGGLIEQIRTEGPNVFNNGFERFRSLVVVIGVYAIITALADENLIEVTSSNQTTIGSLSIPAEFAGEFNGLQFEPFLSLVALAGYSVALVMFWISCTRFMDHDLEKNVLILGPDRGGKTWFMGGTAYCLVEEAIDEARSVDPDPNLPLDQIRNVFANGNFDHPLLEPNDPDEYHFFRFQFRFGLIKRQIVTVKTVDYAGEHLKQIETEEPWDAFTDKWNYDRIPTFEELRRDSQNNNIDPDMIPSLLSILAVDADLLGLVLPMDEFADELEEDELPSYLDPYDLSRRRGARQVPTRTSDQHTKGYFESYKELCDKNNFFFLGTMSDVFLKTYNEQEGGYPRTSWEQFRKHVWSHVQDKAERVQFDPGRRIDMDNHKYMYPVYFEADLSDARTDSGEFKPNLDWGDDDYSLRGLQYVLNRLGR